MNRKSLSALSLILLTSLATTAYAEDGEDGREGPPFPSQKVSLKGSKAKRLYQAMQLAGLPVEAANESKQLNAIFPECSRGIQSFNSQGVTLGYSCKFNTRAEDGRLVGHIIEDKQARALFDAVATSGVQTFGGGITTVIPMTHLQCSSTPSSESRRVVYACEILGIPMINR